MLRLTARQHVEASAHAPATIPSCLQAEPLSEAEPLMPSTVMTVCPQQSKGNDVEQSLHSKSQASSPTDLDQAEPASAGQKVHQGLAALSVHVPGVISAAEPAGDNFQIKAGTYLPPQQRARAASPKAPCALVQQAEQKQQKRLPGTRVDQQVLHHLLKQASPDSAGPVCLQQPPE